MSDESRGLTKWQLALVVGVGAAAVAGGALLCYAATRGGSGTKGTSDEGGQPDQQERGRSGDTGAATGGTTPPVTQSALDRARKLKQEGNTCFKNGNPDEALTYYKEALKVCPDDATSDRAIFLQNIAAVYDLKASKTQDEDQKASFFHAVVDWCSQALELNPRYVKALSRRLKAHDAIGNKKEALLDVTRVLLLDESQGRTLSQSVPNLLKEIGKQQAAEHFPKLGPLAPPKHLVKSYFEAFLWNDDLSEERLRAIWSSEHKVKPSDQSDATEESHDQNDTDTQDQQPPAEESHDPLEGFYDDPFVIAAVMYREEHYSGIIEVLTEAVDSGFAAFKPHALLLRGSMYALYREHTKALKDFSEVVNTQGLSNEMYISALLKKAAIFSGDGDTEKSTTCFEKVFAIDSNCADAYIHRARQKLETDDLQQLPSVLEDLEKAIKLSPKSPYAAYSLASAHHRMAGIHQSMQMLEIAQTKFNEATKAFPDYADGLVLYALFLQDLTKFSEAQEVLNKAAKLDPENPLVHYSLGLLMIVFVQDVTKAMSHLEKAIQVDNSCVQAYDTLASLELQRENNDRALELYDRAVQFSRSQVEMAQAFLSKSVIEAQQQACNELGITMQDLAKRLPTSFQ